MAKKKPKEDKKNRFRRESEKLGLGNVEEGFDDMGTWTDGRERMS